MLFSPDVIHQVIKSQSSSTDLVSTSSSNQWPSPPVINCQSSSADLLSSSSSSNQWPSPPPTAIHVNDNSGEEQNQPSLFLFLPITHETSDVRSGTTTPLAGCDTPRISDAAKAEVKPIAKGQEKGAVAYSVEEHVAVLQLMLSQPKASNASESSEEWRDLYQQMCQEYYIPSGSNPQSSFMLHEHLIEMYTAFKKAFQTFWCTKVPCFLWYCYR
jgi:hypothetical protein